MGAVGEARAVLEPCHASARGAGELLPSLKGKWSLAPEAHAHSEQPLGSKLERRRACMCSKMERTIREAAG